MRLKSFILFVASDQILKLLAVKFFHPALNSGVAFGIGENIPVIATIVVYLILFISIYTKRAKTTDVSPWMKRFQYPPKAHKAVQNTTGVSPCVFYKSGFKYGEMLLLAGGAGNILDRLISGKIVDWIRFGNLWFNLADVYIAGGIILIINGIIFTRTLKH